MKKIDKLQKLLDTHIPSAYWSTTYQGSKIPISIDMDSSDWNQTLITKINEVAARIYKDGEIGGPETISISGKYSLMQSLIHSLLYMKSDVTMHKGYYCIGKLAGKYDILVIPNLLSEDKIFVCKQYDTSKDPFNVENYAKIGVVQIQKLNSSTIWKI